MHRTLVTASVMYIGVVISIAHLVAPGTYDWTRNTISDLGAQGYAHAWIMRLGFIGFGALLSTGVLLKRVQARRMPLANGLVLVYAVAVLLTGCFSVAPFDGTPLTSPTQDALHTVFAQLAGMAFSLSIVTHWLCARTSWARGLHGGAFVLVVAMSLLVVFSEAGSVDVPTGLAQRLLWIISFAWLLYGSRQPLLVGPKMPTLSPYAQDEQSSR